MNEKFLIPLSIIIAGILVAGGFFLTENQGGEDNTEKLIIETQKRQRGISLVNPKIDRIAGDYEKAEIFIIAYFNLECPGCKIYHQKSFLPLVEKYSQEKKVAFVKRHFPFDKSFGGREPRHPTSGKQARATECAYEQGGNEKFFDYISAVFNETQSDGIFPLERLPKIALELGLNEEEFISCLQDQKIADRVEASFQEAIRAGLISTPSVFIQIKNSGRNFEAVIEKSILDQAIREYLQK